MKIGLALNTNLDEVRNTIINDVLNKIEIEFATKSYGDDLKELYIGIICVKAEFEQFFKPRKVKYHKGIRTSCVDGFTYIFEDVAEYEIKLDYPEYSKLDEESIKLKLSAKILDSLDCLKKIKNLEKFDFKIFKKDISAFLTKTA